MAVVSQDATDRVRSAHGRSLDPEQCDAEPLKRQLEHPVLAACYQAAARGVIVSAHRAGPPTLRLITSASGNSGTGNAPDEPVADLSGINLYAKQVVDGANRAQVDRLCRYITRPPVAQDRLTLRSDGQLALTFKHPWVLNRTCQVASLPHHI